MFTNDPLDSVFFPESITAVSDGEAAFPDAPPDRDLSSVTSYLFARDGRFDPLGDYHQEDEPMAEEASKFRLQLDVSVDALRRIDEIKDRIDAGTRAEVVRRALRVFDYVTSDDVEVIIRSKDGRERILETR